MQRRTLPGTTPPIPTTTSSPHTIFTISMLHPLLSILLSRGPSFYCGLSSRMVTDGWTTTLLLFFRIVFTSIHLDSNRHDHLIPSLLSMTTHWQLPNALSSIHSHTSLSITTNHLFSRYTEATLTHHNLHPSTLWTGTLQINHHSTLWSQVNNTSLYASYPRSHWPWYCHTQSLHSFNLEHTSDSNTLSTHINPFKLPQDYNNQLASVIGVIDESQLFDGHSIANDSGWLHFHEQSFIYYTHLHRSLLPTLTHIPLIITSLAHSHLSSIAFYSTNHYPTLFQSLKRRGCRYYQQTITFPIHFKLFTPPINEIITEDLFIQQLPLSACSCSRRDTRHRSFHCQHQ